MEGDDVAEGNGGRLLKRSLTNLLVASPVLAALVIVGLRLGSSADRAEPPAVPEPPAAFRVGAALPAVPVDAPGEEGSLSLSELPPSRHRVLVLANPGCAHCHSLLDALLAMAPERRSACRLDVALISVGPGSDRAAESFAPEAGKPRVRLYRDAEGAIVRDLGVRSVPLVVLANRENRIVAVDQGWGGEAALARTLGGAWSECGRTGAGGDDEEAA